MLYFEHNKFKGAFIMDDNENKDISQSNENLERFIALQKDKKFGILFGIPAIAVWLCYMLFLFLPVAKIMYYHPKSVTVLDLGDYSVNGLPLIACSVIIPFGAFGIVLAFALLQKGKLNPAVVTSILFGIAEIFGCAFASVLCDDVATAIEKAAQMRTDVGAAKAFLFVGGIIAACYDICYGVCLALIKDGKIQIKELTKKQ